MSLAVEAPWVLASLALALLPLLSQGMRFHDHPELGVLPADPLSSVLSWLLRLCAMAVISALVLGMAGLHRTGQTVERIGHGAHIVLLLDRSNSMDNSFAGRAPDGENESKSSAARRLLAEFVGDRKHDLIGLAEYSTAPFFVMPLTENRQAVQAAIAATAAPALAYTHVGKGLAMALSFFQEQPVTGSRIIVLVSDGAAAIDPDSEQSLRKWFKEKQVRLYWIFLRTANSPGIYDKPADPRDDNAQAMPERFLHQFFVSLGVPYQAYQAESPNALKEAIAEINRLENLPIHYIERIPRQDLSGFCYLLAGGCLLILILAKSFEVELS
ncbi:MAG: vWA domain-containing protein [Gammaproteobacteria bacterium]